MTGMVLKILSLLLCLEYIAGQDYGFMGSIETGQHLMRAYYAFKMSSHVRLDGLIDNRDIKIKARDIVTRMNDTVRQDNVTLDCWRQVQQLMKAMSQGEKWALAFVDSFGKPASGVMALELVWLGNWKQCVTVDTLLFNDNELESQPLLGKYCIATYMIPYKDIVGVSINSSFPMRLGLCFPSSCSSSDAVILADTFVSLTSLNTSTWPTEPEMTCQDRDLPFDTRAIIVMVVCGVVVALIISGTAVDVFYIQRTVNTERRYEETANTVHTHADITNTEHRHGNTANGDVQNGGFQYDDPVMKGTQSKDCLQMNAVTRINTRDYVDGANNDIKVTTANTQQGRGEREARQDKQQGPGILVSVLTAFSLYTNVKKLLDSNGGNGDSLAAVHGIRVVCMMWVIASHTHSWAIYPFTGNLFHLESILTRFTDAVFSNGSVSVDVFFVLSGCLVTYLTLKEMKKRGGAGRFPWGMFYLQRYLRLTPVYMFWIMVYSSLMKYWGEGPLWDQKGYEVNGCVDWWRNLLYINNLVDSKNHCMAWSYYLANDMQFYILSPLMMIPLYHFPWLGCVSCLLFLLTGMVSPGVITRVYDLPPVFYYDMNKMWDYMNKVYFKPWCRVGPYAVGVFTGYLLYRYNGRVKIPRVVNILGWLLAIGLGLSILYGLVSPDIIKNLSPDVTALYNATSRSVFGACFAWVIFACATGNGGICNSIMSWSAFVPLGRLTYCAYLVHPVFLTIYNRNRQTVLHLDDYGIVYMCIGNTCLSFAAAFVLSMAIERPFALIEKVVFGAKRK